MNAKAFRKQQELLLDLSEPKSEQPELKLNCRAKTFTAGAQIELPGQNLYSRS